MADSQTAASLPVHAARFKILVNGEAIPARWHVLAVSTSREVGRVPSSRIVLLDGDPAQGLFPASDGDLFIPGGEIEIRAGYKDDETTLFQGLVVRHGLKVKRDAPSRLILDCKHTVYRSTLRPRSRQFVDMTDAEIAEELLGAYDLSADVEPSAVSHSEMVQYQVTDWDFLISRLEAVGMILIADDDSVRILPPALGDEVLTLAYGSSVIEFEAQIDARDQLTGVTTCTWDVAEQALLEVEAADPGLTPPGNLTADELASQGDDVPLALTHPGDLPEEELQAWADARLGRSRLAQVRGRVRCDGFAEVSPGDTLTLESLGDRFNGQVFVSGVRHEFRAGTWETDIQFGLRPQTFNETHAIAAPVAGGLLPGLPHLQIGVVRQLADDPEGEDRILVNLPLVDPDEEGLWARVVCLDAGKERGSFFRPEIEDEVIVAFLGGDPRAPIVLGMLNSSAKPAPFVASDDNHEKGFVTRGGSRLVFNDETNVIVVETPGGNHIELNDDDGKISMTDQNENLLDMTSDGITLESATDLVIKAGGDIKIEGMGIAVEAGGELKLAGSSKAEISSSATTEVKGSLVKIN